MTLHPSYSTTFHHEGKKKPRRNETKEERKRRREKEEIEKGWRKKEKKQYSKDNIEGEEETRKRADRGSFWGNNHPFWEGVGAFGREKNPAVENVKRKSAVRSQRAHVSGRGWRRGRKTLWWLGRGMLEKMENGRWCAGVEGGSVKLPRKEYKNFFSLSLSLCNSSLSNVFNVPFNVSPMDGWYLFSSFLEQNRSRIFEDFSRNCEKGEDSWNLENGVAC